MQVFKLKCWTLVILFYLCRKLIIFVFWAVGRTKHVIWRNQLELRKWEEDFLLSTFWHFIRTFIRRFCPKWLTVIHTFIHWCRCHVRPAHQEQFGVQCLAQGHFDIQTTWIEPTTFQWQDAGSTSEPQLLLEIKQLMEKIIGRFADNQNNC